MITFEQVKKHSENYARLIRDEFPLSFENEKLNNVLNTIVFNDEKTIFANKLKEENKIQDFKTFIYSIVWDEEKFTESNKSSIELLDLVWYNLYICKNKEDVQQFKKYYKDWEVICTFNDIEWRLNKYHIFWIVKKDIDNIKHQWANRNRQDIYWTSCCSIQINKNNNSDISIKNRYNHAVNSCDATFSNNLDNIVEWLTQSINKEFNLKTVKNKNNFELSKFIFKDNKYIYYNYEINNIYYWINKIYKDWKITIYDTNSFILIDYYLINIKEKKIEKIDNTLNDDFFNFKFNKILIKKNINDSFSNDDDIEWVLTIYK